jgi:hypothetical protein
VNTHRDSRKATQNAAIAANAANAKAVDIATQMDAANDQNAQLRDLNSKFIKELRAARRTNGDTVAAAEKHREAADAMVRV